MNKEQQIAEMAKIVDEMYNVYTTQADDIAEGLYNAGYRKIDDLKAEIKRLKTECALLDDELRIARQDTIDVLNKVKEKLNNAPNGWANTTYIDELIKENL